MVLLPVHFQETYLPDAADRRRGARWADRTAVQPAQSVVGVGLRHTVAESIAERAEGAIHHAGNDCSWVGGIAQGAGVAGDRLDLAGRSVAIRRGGPNAIARTGQVTGKVIGSAVAFGMTPQRPDRSAHSQQGRARRDGLRLLCFRSHEEYGRRLRKKTNTGYSIAIPTNHMSFHSSAWVRMTAKAARCTDRRMAVSVQNFHSRRN